MKAFSKLRICPICVILTFLLVTYGCLMVDKPSDELIDIDGNIYSTVQIGEQVWMRENLKVTHYSDGTAIPFITNSEGWSALETSSKAYCWYDDDPAKKESYGALYTWAAAMNGAASSNTAPSRVQGACPVGWHLPSNKEWEILINFIYDAGYGFGENTLDVAKAMAATTGWPSKKTPGTPGNDPATNNGSGFTAVPSGFRESYGSFGYYRSVAAWWSSTEDGLSNAKFWMMISDSISVINDPESKKYGFYVRCVKDK